MAFGNNLREGEQAPSVDRRQFLRYGSAAAVVSILGSPQTVEAQQTLQTRFSTYQEAKRYAKQNDFVMVNTSQNGTVFMKAEYLRSIQSDSRFSVTGGDDATGIYYIISVNPDTRVKILEKNIIGGRNGRIDIAEARQGSGDETRGNNDTGTDTDDDGPTDA